MPTAPANQGAFRWPLQKEYAQAVNFSHSNRIEGQCKRADKDAWPIMAGKLYLLPDFLPWLPWRRELPSAPLKSALGGGLFLRIVDEALAALQVIRHPHGERRSAKLESQARLNTNSPGSVSAAGRIVFSGLYFGASFFLSIVHMVTAPVVSIALRPSSMCWITPCLSTTNVVRLTNCRSSFQMP